MLERKALVLVFTAILLVVAGCSTATNEESPADEMSGSDAAITDIVWQWQGTVTPVEEITVDDPTQYTLTLLSDGTAAINADCNAASTTYQLDGQSITIDEPMAMTMAFCGEDSLSDEFVRQVGVAAITFMDGEDLMIDLFADGGTMRFANGGPAEAE